MARLRSVPQTTPLPAPQPAAIDDDGSAMFATFAPMAALVPQPRPERTSRTFGRARPYVASFAAVALAGTLVAGSAARAADERHIGRPGTPTVGPADTVLLHARP